MIALNYGAITMIDDWVGRILDALEQAGKAENTVVVFMSDHGDYMGDHGTVLKHGLHSHGLIRVPLIWADPRRAGASVSSRQGSAIDFAPTLLQSAGIACPVGMQGRDLLAEDAAELPVLIEDAGLAFASDDGRTASRTLVHDGWRMTVFEGSDLGELYDLAADPSELSNLWADPGFAARKGGADAAARPAPDRAEGHIPAAHASGLDRLPQRPLDILIVGGGIAGCCAAIALTRTGHRVRIVEKQEAWRFQSSGIFVYANGLESLGKLGLLEDILAAGFPVPEGRNAYYDHLGQPIVETFYPTADASRIPAILGIKRAEMHRVMAGRVAALGVPVQLGTTVTELKDGAGGVTATLSDGSVARVDLVIAADGVRSATRALIGIEVAPRYSGVGVWRAVHRRPPELTDKIMMMGPAKRFGIMPISDELLLYLRHRGRTRGQLLRARRLAPAHGRAVRGVHRPRRTVPRGAGGRDRGALYGSGGNRASAAVASGARPADR